MYLLLLIFIFGLIGYFLAESRVGNKIDEAAVDASDSSKRLFRRTVDGTCALFGIKPLFNRFDVWVNTIGSDLLAPEFVSWYTNLSDGEARSFLKSLSAHMKSLGFRLKELVDGSLDKDPVLRQVFVETIVVYSQEFRKVKQARQEVDTDESEDAASEKEAEGKKKAKKSSSRRKTQTNDEVDFVELTSAV